MEIKADIKLGDCIRLIFHQKSGSVCGNSVLISFFFSFLHGRRPDC